MLISYISNFVIWSSSARGLCIRWFYGQPGKRVDADDDNYKKLIEQANKGCACTVGGALLYIIYHITFGPPEVPADGGSTLGFRKDIVAAKPS
jgi:hypothetical protein